MAVSSTETTPTSGEAHVHVSGWSGSPPPIVSAKSADCPTWTLADNGFIDASRGAVATAVNTTSTVPARAVTAWLPSAPPSVHRAEARPTPSVWSREDVMTPSPPDTVHETAAPGMGVPPRSLTSVLRLPGSGDPALPRWASPETLSIESGTRLTVALTDAVAAPDEAVMVA